MLNSYVSKKRVLVVCQHFYPESFRINDLVDGLIEDGYSVDVLCGIPNYPSGEWNKGYGYFSSRRENYHGATIYRSLEIRRKGNTALRIFLNYVSWPLTASFKAMFLRKNYDVVFCYNTSPVLMIIPAKIASIVNRCALVTYVLDIWPENLYTVLNVNSGLLRNFAQAFSDWSYRLCDHLIALSISLADNLSHRINTGNTNYSITVLPQHCEQFYERKTYSLELRSEFAEKTVFLFAGSITPAQDLKTVLDAFECASARLSESPFLLVLGDGMSRGEIESYAQKLKCSQFIKFYGKVPPEVVSDYFDISTASITPFANYPELELTVPAKVASCMAASQPILAVMKGEGAKAIKESHCGLVSDPSDVQSLADNMVTIASMSDEDRAVMASNGFEYYSKHYSRRRSLDIIEQVLFS